MRHRERHKELSSKVMTPSSLLLTLKSYSPYLGFFSRIELWFSAIVPNKLLHISNGGTGARCGENIPEIPCRGDHGAMAGP